MKQKTQEGEYFSLGLTGYPLSHSLSPVIQNAALQACGLLGSYDCYPAAALPEGEQALLGLVERMRIGEIQGLNITIPHKQAVIKWIDRLSPAAQIIGAVNTLLVRDGELVGENTDAAGFLADLKQKFPGQVKKNALVLGAGGSARAVVYSLLKEDYQVAIASRRFEQAVEIVDNFQDLSSRATAIDLAYSTLAGWVAQMQGESVLIVNCTPLGMRSYAGLSPWPEGLAFPMMAHLYDLVYNPLETRLVSQARQAGLFAYTGLGMLVEQAALSFELWTGQEAPRQIMLDAASGAL